MGDKIRTLSLDSLAHKFMLSDIYKAITESKERGERVRSIGGIVERYITENADSPHPQPIKYHFLSDDAVEIFAIKLSHLASDPEIDIGKLEIAIDNITSSTPDIKRGGIVPFKKPTPKPKAKRKSTKREIPEEVLEIIVKEEMNGIYLGNKTKIDKKILSHAPVDKVQRYARNYLLKLLIGRYDTLDDSLMKVNKMHQRAVYDALRAYLPFRDNDQLFLFKDLYLHNKDHPELIPNDPDWPIADTLIARVKGTKEYTNIQMARLPLIVLVSGDRLRQMSGYRRYKGKIESGNQRDEDTLKYINQTLKREVVMSARGIYQVPHESED